MDEDEVLRAGGSLQEAIAGWRVWNLKEHASEPRLIPAGSGVDAWEPRRAAKARCGASSLLVAGIGRHTAPDIRCTCGIYAGRSLETFERSRPAWPPPPVIGTVSLWGTVIEHERGWRAGFAYPARLRLVCAMCAWFEPGTGVPEVVHRFAGKLYTLCAAHRGGIQVPDGRRTQPTGLDPTELQTRLIQAYAVDLLPKEALGSLCEQPATPALPYMPTIRVVPIEDEGRDAGVTLTGAWRAIRDAWDLRRR
jgi:hypothetical protein